VVQRLTSAAIHRGPQSPTTEAAAGAPINIPTPNPLSKITLGVTPIEVDYTNHVISIDALNTFPEMFWQGDKIDLGNITLAVQRSPTAATPIATLAYRDYDQGSYEQGGGIIDVKFDPALAQQIVDGTLVFQAPAPDGTVTALGEQLWVAQTDERGIYLNEGESKSFDVSVSYKGNRAPNAKLLIAKYAPALSSLTPLSYLGAPVNAVAATDPQIVSVTNGKTSVVRVTGDGAPIDTSVTVVDVDANGVAHVDIAAVSAGLPVLMFYPFAADAAAPTPAYDFDNKIPSGISYYTTIRVLPFDDAFVDRFVDLWNSTFDRDKAWDFVYSNILYLYDMIYPVMLRFVPLGDRTRAERAIDQVLTLTAPSYVAESTLAMPMTRDLSQGMRTVLQLWGSLVKKNYPPQPIGKPGQAEA
jgi:hypothetical protein